MVMPYVVYLHHIRHLTFTEFLIKTAKVDKDAEELTSQFFSYRYTYTQTNKQTIQNDLAGMISKYLFQ